MLFGVPVFVISGSFNATKLFDPSSRLTMLGTNARTPWTDRRPTPIVRPRLETKPLLY